VDFDFLTDEMQSRISHLFGYMLSSKYMALLAFQISLNYSVDSEFYGDHIPTSLVK
jgi:hypothetical protein